MAKDAIRKSVDFVRNDMENQIRDSSIKYTAMRDFGNEIWGVRLNKCIWDTIYRDVMRYRRVY